MRARRRDASRGTGSCTGQDRARSRLDEQAAGASDDERVSADDADRAAPPDPARNVDELNEETNGGRTPA